MITGIDLGTTFSLISYVNAQGHPALCPARNDPKRFLTPSVVHIGSRGCLVGQLVENLLEEEPALPICRFAKLSMGQPGATVFRDHEGVTYSPEAISALILRKLKLDAEAATGERITGTVITVPAHFNEAQRQATIAAGRLAELPVLGLVEEPVAAATYFGLGTRETERTLFVFDLGGGTLDATVLQATPEGLFVLATEGSTNLGGKNFDELIMDIVREQFRVQHRAEPGSDAESQQRLRKFATAAKMELSEPGRGVITRSLLLSGQTLRVTIHRAQFEAAAEPWLEAAQVVCEDALKAAGMAWQSVDEVILTGGSSLVPCVERKVRDISRLPQARVRREQPHAAIAYGAALLAEQFHGQRRTAAPPLRQTVTTNELGLRVFDPEQKRAVFHPLIEKNMPVPVSAKQTLYTLKDEQASLAVEVLQRKDRHSAPETLGDFRFGPIASPAKNYPVEITLGFDESGRVTVAARDLRTGATMQRQFGGGEDRDLLDVQGRISKLRLQS